jgi:hypothetical protein
MMRTVRCRSRQLRRFVAKGRVSVSFPIGPRYELADPVPAIDKTSNQPSSVALTTINRLQAAQEAAPGIAVAVCLRSS